MRFLSIGECMAELAPSGDADLFRLGFAGDTYNTAWYLKRLRPDARVSYFTALGDDALSGRVQGAMEAAGIDTAHVTRLEGRSVGLYLISLADGERSFTYWRESSAARRLADDPAALEGAMDGADLVYFSGITLAILDAPGRANLLKALAAARGNGKTVAFDPNLRPRLWPAPDEMTGAIMEGAATSDIALPSFDDESDHFADADPAATARRYAGAGAGTVVVKNGAGAMHVLRDGHAATVSVAPAERVVDTTAAGDSFNAGFLAALDRGRPAEDAAAFGAAVAGRVIGGEGALVPLDMLAPGSRDA